jgi:hypothetical protein
MSTLRIDHHSFDIQQPLVQVPKDLINLFSFLIKFN